MEYNKSVNNANVEIKLSGRFTFADYPVFRELFEKQVETS